jgi:hypothetical protein
VNDSLLLLESFKIESETSAEKDATDRRSPIRSSPTNLRFTFLMRILKYLSLLSTVELIE